MYFWTTVQETMCASYTSIPAPKFLEDRVNAVLAYCLQEDWKVDWNLGQWNDDDNQPSSQVPPIPGRFFRRSKNVNVLIRKQMKHVRLGCLSDPRDVSVLRKDPNANPEYGIQSSH